MKVSVVGVGSVGTAVIGRLVHLPQIREVMVINRGWAKAKAEVIDFQHAQVFNKFTSPEISYGNYEKLQGSDVIILTVGAQPGENCSRNDVFRVNSKFVTEFMPLVEQIAPSAIVIIVTNPVDAVTTVAYHSCNLSRNQIIGAGTIVDTARFVHAMAAYFNISPNNISGCVIGDHGHGFIDWDSVAVCGMSVNDFSRTNGFARVDKENMLNYIRTVAYDIFNIKGYTNHAIAACVCDLVCAISMDTKQVFSVGCDPAGLYGFENVAVGLPCVIGRAGISKVIDLGLKAEELVHLKDAISRVGALVREAY